MSTATVDVPDGGERWLRAWREMDVPEGWHAEVIYPGSITVTPPPSPAHNLIAGRVHQALVQVLPAGAGVYQTLGVRVEALDRAYIPDLVVVGEAALREAASEISAEDVLLAAEITSRDNADHDRKAKRWGYAHGQVPLYLLIDPWAKPEPTATVFSEPAQGDYRRRLQVPFGECLPISAPFELELDTSAFPPGR